MNRLLTSTRWQFSILALWFLTASLAAPFALRVNHELDASTRLQHSEYAAVQDSIRQRFGSPFTSIALLRVVLEATPQSDDGRQVLEQITHALRAAPGVKGVMSYLDRDDRLFIGEDGSAIVVVGYDATGAAADVIMAHLRDATNALQDQLQPAHPTLLFRWTGEAAVSADMRRLSAAATRTAELRVLPITLLLLLVAFRSLTAALLPILCGGLTVLISLGMLAAINTLWPVSIIVVSIISMVGLGLSIDYALLIVSRYREAVDQGLNRGTALAMAAAHGGRTVLVSSSAVAIGFAAMLWVPVSEIRSIAIGGLLVTAIAVLTSSTLLPVLLARLGPLIDTGRLSKRRFSDTQHRWRRWARWVARRPVTVLLMAGAPLVVLAVHATQLRTDLPRGRWLPDSADSFLALHEIDDVARGNFGQIIDIILELPAGTTIQDEAGWRATARYVRHYARDPSIQHVWAVTTVNVSPLGGPEILAKIPAAARRSLVSADGRELLIQLLPKKGLTASDAAKLVREIRASNASLICGLDGAAVKVGGVPAFNIDYEDAIRHSLLRIAAIVVCATLVALAIAFRSALIPLKAVALNLLSVAAAFGAVTFVFQDGYGSQFLGLSGPMAGGFPIVPVLVFGIVFGLSMDYEVFLVARVADGRRLGLSDVDALIEGIGGTGRVITFAAAVMIMVFGGFMFGDFVLIKILGFALSVAVLLDATLIRLAVGPALILLAGRWNWWPGTVPQPTLIKPTTESPR